MSQTLKQMTTDPHRDSLRRVTATATATAPAALAAPALYRAIFAQSPDAIVVAGFDGRLVEANAAALALLGYTAEELPRLWIQDILRPSPEWSIAEALRLLGEQGLWQGEADIITRSGELVPTASHTFTLEGSAPPMLVSFLRDLRGAKADEVTRARLAAIVTSSADAVIGESLDGVVTDWNPAAERLYGYSAQEVIGRHLTMLIPPDSIAEAEDLLARARGGESIEGFEAVRRHKSGRQIAISLTISPVWNAAQQVIATAAIARDISARKAAEAELASSEVRFRTAFADAPIGMSLVSPNGHILQVNRAMRELLGYSEAELLDMTFAELTHPDDLAANVVLSRRALAGEIRTYEMEKRYLRKDGQLTWVLLSASLVRDEAGAPLYFISQIQDISERKAAEAELAATQQSTRDVLERLTDGFCALDLEWRFSYINAAAEGIFGRSREELLGRNLWEEFAAAAETPIYGAFQAAMRTGETTAVEWWYPPCDLWFDVRAYPSANGLSVFFRDITESRALESELRASEAKYRSLVEQYPVVVYLLAADDNQSAIYYSPHVQELLGITQEEALARTSHWLEFVHPEDRERVATVDLTTSASGEPFSVEYRLMRGDDGSYVWVLDNCLPVRDDAGEVVGWQGVLIDITERRRADEAQGRLAAIVAGAEDAIISRTLDGIITSWNAGAEKLYGYRAEEMIGRSFGILVPEGEFAVAQLAAETPREQVHFEATRIRRDGAAIAVSISLSPIRDSNGRTIGVSSITRDITARKRAEEELRAALDAAQAANRATSQFLAMMSHELRTPMQAVLGYADLLLGGADGALNAEQVEDIGFIRQGALRMTTLVDQMLDLTRIEAGQLALAIEPVNLAEVIEQVRQDVAPQAAVKGLELQIVVPAALPPVAGDPLRLRQILLNLAGNAVKFTERGTVRIGVEVTATGVDIAVSDSGIGIAPEALEHIFDEFRQADSSMTRRYGGAGLGLAIARKLAEQHGGTIGVRSRVGEGSTFTLHLPSATLPAAVTPRA